jgi:citrate lyase beta subunit
LPWVTSDVAAVAGCGTDAVLAPKIESAAAVLALIAALDEAGAAAGLPVWAMVETPRAFLRLENDAGLAFACVQGRDMGYDGKTLIHPKQIATANAASGPSSQELRRDSVVPSSDAPRLPLSPLSWCPRRMSFLCGPNSGWPPIPTRRTE